MSHCLTSQELNVSVTVWKTSFLTLCSFNDLKHPITTVVNSVNRDLVIQKLIVSSCGLAGVFYGFSFFKSCIMKWVNVITITLNLQLLPFSPSESKDEESEAAFCWHFSVPHKSFNRKLFHSAFHSVTNQCPFSWAKSGREPLLEAPEENETRTAQKRSVLILQCKDVKWQTADNFVCQIK